MAVALRDTFTVGSNTTLASHAPEVGGTWVQHAAAGDTATIWSATDRVSSASGGLPSAIYYNDKDPGSDDYDLDFTLTCVTDASNSFAGVMLRAATGANTNYLFGHSRGDGWRIYRVVAGVLNVLATGGSTTLSAGVTYTCNASVSGVGATVTVALVVDDVALLSVNDTHADRIVTRGLVGVRSSRAGSSSGYHLDNLELHNNVPAPTFVGTMTDANTLRCVWTLPSGRGWTAPVTVADLIVAVTVGSETIYADAFGSPSISTVSNANDTLTLDIDMGGYVYDDEAATVTIQSGLVQDSLDEINGASSATAITNNSAAVQDSDALSRQAANPIFLWDVPDKYPWDGATAYVAVRGADNFSGTEKVVYTFFESDGTTPTNVTVGASSANSHEITAPVWLDLYGYGDASDRWALAIVASSLPAWSSTSNDIKVTATVHLNDGTTYALPEQFTLRKAVASPTVLWVATDGNDANPGTEGSPLATLAAAVTLADDSTDEIILKAGTHVHPGDIGNTIYTSDTRTRWLTIRAADGLAATQSYEAGVHADNYAVAIDPTAKLTIGRMVRFKDIRFVCADIQFCRTRSEGGGDAPYCVLENCLVEFSTIMHPANDQSPVSLSGRYTGLIHYKQRSGFRGAIMGGLDAVVDGYAIYNSGTGSRQVSQQVWNRYESHDAFSDPDFATHPAAPVHSDDFHYDSGAQAVISRLIVSNVRSINSGCAISLLNNYGQHGLLVYNYLFWGPGSRVLFQLEADQPDAFNNVQIANCTIMQKGTVDDDATLGFSFNTNVHVSNFERRERVAILNCVSHNTPASIESDVWAARRFGGNLFATGYSWADFSDADPDDYEGSNMGPGTGSSLLAASVPSDIRFDINGVALSNDGTDAIGAEQQMVTLTAPADNATDQPTTLTFSWEAYSLAGHYHLFYTPDGGAEVEVADIAGTSHQVSGLDPNTEYTWYVVAHPIDDTHSAVATSETWTFTTAAGSDNHSRTTLAYGIGIGF